MRYLQYVTWIVGLGLEALVITALLRGAYRRFPIIFTYCCIQFCTIVIEVAAYTAKASSFLGHLRMSRARYYWGIDAILQVLVFAVVISLTYQASAKTRHRELM